MTDPEKAERLVAFKQAYDKACEEVDQPKWRLRRPGCDWGDWCTYRPAFSLDIEYDLYTEPEPRPWTMEEFVDGEHYKKWFRAGGGKDCYAVTALDDSKSIHQIKMGVSWISLEYLSIHYTQMDGSYAGVEE